ncbi:MAG: GyrI-like domain-containing protein [bacterium]
MASRIRRFGAVVFVLLIILALLAGGIGYSLGVFSPVKISTQIRGPYLMVYMLHRGAYHQVSNTIEKVGKLLDERKIQKTIPCAVFYDDPKDVPLENLKSEGGYLVNQQLSLEHPFGQRQIPSRGVILATVKAHPMIAPFKIYGRIVDFMKMHELEYDGPAMERYLPGGIVEVEMPFRSPNTDRLHQDMKGMHVPGSHEPPSHVPDRHQDLIGSKKGEKEVDDDGSGR